MGGELEAEDDSETEFEEKNSPFCLRRKRSKSESINVLEIQDSKSSNSLPKQASAL